MTNNSVLLYFIYRILRFFMHFILLLGIALLGIYVWMGFYYAWTLTHLGNTPVFSTPDDYDLPL